MRFAPCLLVSLGLGLSGCSWLTPFIFLGQHKERIPAEYDKLAGRTVAVAVWTDQEILFDYPYVRMELGLHIGDRIAANVEKVKVADGRKIEDYMQRSLANTVDPVEIGRRFECEMVVYVELLDFQIRNPESPDFLSPLINASISVYDLSVDPDEPKHTELSAVKVEQRGQLFNETSAQVARKALYEEFAETIGRKFYEHKVEMVK